MVKFDLLRIKLALDQWRRDVEFYIYFYVSVFLTYMSVCCACGGQKKILDHENRVPDC